MKVPHAQRAVVDIRKLTDYCLNTAHDEGKHKARLFAAALGMTEQDAADLREALLEIVKKHDASLRLRDEYGQRYTIDFQLKWRGRQAMIRSGWIIEHDSEIPRLTTCYPL